MKQKKIKKRRIRKGTKESNEDEAKKSKRWRLRKTMRYELLIDRVKEENGRHE